MPDSRLHRLERLLTTRQPTDRIAYHNRRYYFANEFIASVHHWVADLQAQPYQRYALYSDDAYPFTVLLFALFHAGKQVWLAGNNRPGTAQQLQQHGCQLIGDWQTHQCFDYQLTKTTHSAAPLSPLNATETCLVLFTSGSTGEPKPIEKRLLQLQREVTTLENQWGVLLGNAEILATVSHQHIYGLLFRVLWPLSAGRCFHSTIYLNPEILANNIQASPACWIASPAHLKRLDQDSPWQAIAGLTAIFSSGGTLLHLAKQQISQYAGQHVIEIYGSTETGGIAWRQHDTAWQLFEGLQLQFTDGKAQLYSPYLINKSIVLEDQIALQTDGRFMLHGRLDRIVKIEEKRLSLSELEQRLVDSGLVAEAFAVALAKNRDVVGAALVLTETGYDLLNRSGRNAFIRQLRSQLHQWFDAVVLPRKWLIVDSLPLNSQGKLDHSLLKTLLDVDNHKLPQLQHVSNTSPNKVELALRVPEELVYFPDHFAGYPLLPGVVQIAWAEYFGKLFFLIDAPFSAMEVLKFVKTIQPGIELRLALNWNAETGKLQFNFRSGDISYSSGRIIYAAQP